MSAAVTVLSRRALVGAALALPLGRAVGAAETWRMATEYPATAIPGEGVAFFAASVARLAGGALEITPGFESMRSAAMVAAVAENQLQAADAFTGALAATAPIFELSALPFLTASGSDTARLLEAARPNYETVLRGRGLSLLYATPWPASGIWSRRPLTGPDTLDGLRIRTYDAASLAVFKAAWAAPVQISFADAMPRLRAGELDAVLSSGDGGAGARLWDILPHFTVINYASPLSLAFCRTAALEALPATVADTVAQAARETEARQWAALATRGAENVQRMRQNGVVIADTPELRAALASVAAPVISGWEARAGADGQAALARYRRG